LSGGSAEFILIVVHGLTTGRAIAPCRRWDAWQVYRDRLNPDAELLERGEQGYRKKIVAQGPALD
jgi:hypothetical protein